MAFKITRGNIIDISVAGSLLSALDGLALGDKGYIGKKLFDELFKKGLKLITRKRKNMKEKLVLTNYPRKSSSIDYEPLLLIKVETPN